MIEIVILLVYYYNPFGFSLFWHFRAIFSLLKPLCLASDHWWGFITRNAHMVHVVNEIRLNFLYILVEFSFHISTTCWVSLLVDQWVTRGHVVKFYTVDFGWFVAFWKHQHFPYKIDWNCNFVGFSHHPFWLQLVLERSSHLFSSFETTLFG